MAISRLSIVKFLELFSKRSCQKETMGASNWERRTMDPNQTQTNIEITIKLLPNFSMQQALTCSCVALHYHSYNVERDLGMLVTGTFVGYLIIFAGTAAGYLMQTPAHKRIDIFYSLVGVGLFVASGGVIIDRYQHTSGEVANKNLAKASLAIINGAVLLIDAVFTQRGG